MKPLAIDLYCGLGGWTEGLLAEGYYVVGFDIERHRYPARALPDAESRKVMADGVNFNNPAGGDSRNRSFNYANQCAVRDAPLTGGWLEYPAQLVLQDVTTLHGAQFKDAALIVASPPCQAYSYRAMPWKRAKALPPPDNTLFEACFRIQREAIEAAGRHIPLVVENVRGAQKWVGRARWNFGSFYLWGDVPALMPIIAKRSKLSGRSLNAGEGKWRPANGLGIEKSDAIKNSGGSWFAVAHNTTSGKGQNPDGRKQPGISGVRANGKGDRWFQDGAEKSGSKSNARKAASAMIAKIPIVLARHIAQAWKPLQANQ